MNMLQLKYFMTVAQFENVSRAAQSLHVSQSALSKQIRNLESELGISLFDRNGKNISLNNAGRRFYDSSSLILRELDSAEDDVKKLIYKQDHRLRLGFVGIPEKMPACLGQFASEHPGTEFVLNGHIDFEEFPDINEYDAVVCPEEFRYEKLHGYHLYDEGYYFAVNSSGEAAREKSFSPDMLKGSQMVFMQGSSAVPELPYRICAAFTEKPESIIFTDSREVHRKMISIGEACGFVPKSEAESYKQDLHIRLLLVLDRRFQRAMKICFLRDKHLSELGRAFKEHVTGFFDLKD